MHGLALDELLTHLTSNSPDHCLGLEITLDNNSSSVIKQFLESALC